MATAWRRHAHGMVTASRRHCDDMATTRRPHGDGLATALRRHGDDTATTWRRHGDDMATTWRRHGDDMATTWRRGQDDNDDGENDDDGDDEDDGDDHETELYIWCRHIHMAMVWWCRSAFVTTKSVFRMFFPRWAPCFLNRARLNGCVSCAGSIQLELCSINGFETTAVFFWQPMSSHVAKVTTWTNVVNLNSGFFDVSVHQYIPSPGRGDEFAGQCREQMVYSPFDPPPCPEMNPSCLELGVRKNMFPVYVVFETPSYMSRLCRKPLRGVPPQSHCTSGFSVPIGI